MFHIDEKGKFKILRAEGELTAMSSVERFRELLSRMMDTGQKHLAVDLTRAVIIDSSAIGCILACHKRLELMGGEIIVVTTPNRVMEALLQTSVHRVIRIVESEHEIR